jgi:hypothetical protein
MRRSFEWIARRLAALVPDGPGPRLLSLLLVALVALAIVLQPSVLGDGASIADRVALALALVGAIGGAAHGFGHRSQNWLLRRAAIPWVAWASMLGGGLWLTFSAI